MNAYLQTLQCRLCAEWKFENVLININDDKAIHLKLESKIEQCLSLNFHNLQLPNNVCLLCCDRVKSAYDFQEQVKKAQQNLLNEISEKTVNFKTELQEPKNEWYQCVETTLDDYDNGIVKEEVKVEENSQIHVIKTENNSKVKHEEKKEKISKDISSIRKKRRKKVVDAEIVKRHAKRSALIQCTKNVMKNYKWNCTTCGIECPSVENLRKHFTDEHKQKPVYSCTECAKTYDIFITFQKHVKAHRDKYRYKCDICSMYFYQSYLLKNHHLLNHSEVNYTCTKCGKNFKTEAYLQKHLRNLHQPVIRLKHECDICGKKLLTTTGLLHHQKAHSGKQDFSCDQCGKMFVVRSHLQGHLNTVHSDIKPFSCNQCQQTFKTKRILQSHLLVHSNEKRYSCEICEKRFKRKDMLTQHSSVHTGVLNFECEYCHKRFREKSKLKIHVRQHTGERPYSCLECNHHFADCSNYIKHMRGKHGVSSIKKTTPTNSEKNKLEFF